MLQFGEPLPGRVHRERPAAFGIAVRDALVAVVRVRPEEGGDYIDLPGGAIDPGEDEVQALIREFGEETGLVVTAGQRITGIRQYFVLSSDEPVNNIAGVYWVEVTGADAALKIEADHELVWVEPADAIRRLRHDGHAWAVAKWMRETG